MQQNYRRSSPQCHDSGFAAAPEMPFQRHAARDFFAFTGEKCGSGGKALSGGRRDAMDRCPRIFPLNEPRIDTSCPAEFYSGRDRDGKGIPGLAGSV
jgi:hypothetical protein